MTLTIESIGPAPIDERAEQVMVPMRDGTRLATDLYLPPHSRPVPAVLVRLPYDKCGRYTFMPALAPHLLARGYALVVQDVRGKFRSEGETMPYLHEVTDGYDTIDWIAAQAWSDGIVGMFGDSYYGWTQWAAVASGHPALRAIVPRMSSADLASIRLATRWDSGIVPLYAADYLAHHWVDQRTHEYQVDWSARPLASVFDDHFRQIGRRSAGLDQLLRQARPIDPFPAGHPFDQPEIPALHSVGWFDNIAPDSMRDYMTLQSRGRTLQYLAADSTDHENYQLADVPAELDHDQHDEALQRLIPRYLGPALDFFDAFLKGGPSESIRRVRWHQGHGDWHAADRWPPPGATPLRLYLDDASRATRDADGGLLTPLAPAAARLGRWTHDPHELVPSTVTNPFGYLLERPDERQVHDRPDVATFTSEAFDAGFDLAGPVEARLSVATTGPSMHVHLKLCDVAPDGIAYMLVRGQVLVPHPDLDRPVSVYLGHTGYRLAPGHRLRLHIASSDFPLYLPHSGDDQNPWRFVTGTLNQQTLRTGGSHPSYLSAHVLGGPPL